MKPTIERAIAALESLPEEVREREISRLEEQAEKLRVLRDLMQEGIEDAEAGNVVDWDLEEFLAQARSQPQNG